MKVQIFLSGVVFIILGVQAERGPILNKFCNNQRDCVTFGYVCGQNQTCTCDKYYVFNKYGDKCVGGIGQKCQYDEHCIEGAFCEHQIKCKCKEDLYPSEDTLTCSRSKQLVNSKPHFYIVSVSFIYLLAFYSVL